VVDFVEALDQKIVSLVDIGIQSRTRVDEAARNFAFVGDLFFCEEFLFARGS